MHSHFVISQQVKGKNLVWSSGQDHFLILTAVAALYTAPIIYSELIKGAGK